MVAATAAERVETNIGSLGEPKLSDDVVFLVPARIFTKSSSISDRRCRFASSKILRSADISLMSSEGSWVSGMPVEVLKGAVGVGDCVAAR